MSTSTETIVTPTSEPTHAHPFWARRWPSLLGLVLSGALVAFADLPHLGLAVAIAACALVYVVWSQFTGQTRTRQWLGLAGFTAVTALAVVLDHRFAMYVIAAGLLGHAAWDVVHYHRREAVSRWYAELCAVVDLVAGLSVLAMTFL